jgi:DNA-binding LacI/PurR family transcriptional regulator
MQPRPPNIREVAEQAGVSTTTVSHVFSGRRPVASATRDRVLSVAEKVGYRPDLAARGLASGKSTVIALELELAGGGILLNPYFSSVLSALSVAALQRGFTFTLLPANPPDGREVRTAIRQDGVAGAIVVDPTISNRWVPALVEDGVRVVCIGRYPGDLETSWVDNDHRQGMRDAMKHLAANGYERLALFSVHEQTSLVIDLEAAFEECSTALGLRGRPLFLPDLTEASAREMAQRLLRSPNRPDAIIGAIDRVAVGVIQAARDAALDVPNDLGVVGLGDTVLAERSIPPLTSMRSTPNELAQEAVTILWETWLEPSLPERQVVLPAELRIRESSIRSAVSGA